eukprot:15464618-Alexandrium_andersonii.AAC.1
MAPPRVRCGLSHVVRSYHSSDVEAQLQGYRLWKHRARTFLLGRFLQAGAVLDWAENQLEPILGQGHPGVVRFALGFEYRQLSGVLFGAMQRAISDQLVMPQPEPAGSGNGVELWRLVVREHEAPEQPVVQRAYQTRRAYPHQRAGADEWCKRLAQWDVWGRELDMARGQALDEGARTCALVQLLLGEFRRALDDQLELQSCAAHL